MDSALVRQTAEADSDPPVYILGAEEESKRLQVANVSVFVDCFTV
jgi:hypothetical protein